MSRRRPSGTGLVIAAALVAPGVHVPLQALAAGQQAVVEANPNLTAAGRYEAGTLHVALEMRMARWHPDGPTGTGLLVPVFAERGKAPQVPAPLLRMPAGTEVVVTLHNALAVSTSVHGLHARPAEAAQPVRLEAGERREFRFSAGAAGTSRSMGCRGHTRSGSPRASASRSTGASSTAPPASTRCTSTARTSR
jgi:FtsP/CotA-like multicopper oxidase with cupredoxin domain